MFNRWYQRHSLLLTHWGRVTHICVSNLTIIGSDNGLSPGRRQATIWTNAGILFIGPLGTNFSEIVIEILTFSFKKMLWKVSSGIWRPFYLGLNVLTRLPLGDLDANMKINLFILVYLYHISLGIIWLDTWELWPKPRPCTCQESEWLLNVVSPTPI